MLFPKIVAGVKTIKGFEDISASSLNLTRLAGDASYRVYYRITRSDEKNGSLLVMQLGKKEISEEVTDGSVKIMEYPFVSVQRYLHQCGLRVPQIYYYNQLDGILLLEDMGDQLFYTRYCNTPSNDHRIALYKKAVDLLVKIQKNTLKYGPRDYCPVFQRSFNAKLFQWEFQHFIEYCLLKYFDAKPSKEEMKHLKQGFDQIVEYLTGQKYIFCHRDFQSRNLLWLDDDNLALIDFQDALMAPPQYDLVALLRDSYIQLPWPMVEELIEYYYQQIVNWDHQYFTNIDELKKAFDFLTIQRKLKDAGRFVFIDTEKNNPSFMPSMFPSLNYVAQALGRTPQFSAVTDVLEKYIPIMSEALEPKGGENR